MTDISYFQDIPKLSIEYIQTIKEKDEFNFLPTKDSHTRTGQKINMGYNCYVLKLYKITNEWDNLSEEHRNKWINYLLNYQDHKNNEYPNYFVDPEVLNYFNKHFSSFSIKNNFKSILNLLLKKNYELKDAHIFKTINADNKQAISTLSEVGFDLLKTPEVSFNNFNNIEDYLNSYNWSKPWDAGAQFSSLSLYNETLKLDINNRLNKFIESKLDQDTGSYFEGNPGSSRQIINGAMKVISGLDWLNQDVHLPTNLIDFCLNNKPEFEGCDLVDYIYVLYKCSSQTNYRKNEIISLFKEVLDYLKLLYHEDEKGFSYFINKSQTHYYGINISKGKNQADIHGTILSVWAIVMILNLLEENIYEYKTIKP